MKFKTFENPPVGALGFIEARTQTEGNELVFVPCIVHSYSGLKPIVAPLGGHNTVVIHKPEDFFIAG